MGNSLMRILGAGIITLGLGSKIVPKVNASTFFIVGSWVVSVDDPNHPGPLENKHELWLLNYSDVGEDFSKVKIEKEGLDDVVYAVDVPEGWVYAMDPNGITLNSTAPEYDILPWREDTWLLVDLWSRYNSVNSYGSVAVAETSGGELTNYSSVLLPNNPEWLLESTNLESLTRMGANWLYGDCSVGNICFVDDDCPVEYSCFQNDYNGDGFVDMKDFARFADVYLKE